MIVFNGKEVGHSNGTLLPTDFTKVTTQPEFVLKGKKFYDETGQLREGTALLASQYDAYLAAKNGDMLYGANFAAGKFNPVDDTNTYFDNGGTTYTAAGTVKKSQLRIWRKNLDDNPDAMIGGALVVKGENTTGVVDHRYVGHFPDYSLENRTYTYEFEYFRNYDKRHKFYFACGSFIDPETGGTITGGGCDTHMPCLALELNYSGGKIGYKLYRQSSGFSNDKNIFNSCTIDFIKNAAQEFTAQIKVVLSGGSKKWVKLYEHCGTIAADGVQTWEGYVVPITFTIYQTVTTDGAETNIKAAAGTIYQPAEIGLVVGVGDYEILPSGKSYGARHFAIYKGDRTKSSSSEESTTLQEIETSAEMDAIISNATSADVGKAYIYVGETTGTYNNNSIYVIKEI